MAAFPVYAQVDSDPEVHPAVFREAGISFAELGLNGYGAGDGIDDAAEIGEESIARRVHHPAAMGLDVP